MIMSRILLLVFYTAAAVYFLSLSVCDAFAPHQMTASVTPRFISDAKALFSSATSSTSVARDELVQELLTACREVGQVGYLGTQEQRDLINDLAQQLAPYSETQPANQPLTGIHDLVYSATEGSSSGRLVGPKFGSVTQEFVDPDIFINNVRLGPLHASLRASRRVLDDENINVKFLETTVRIFGQTLVQKEITGGGVWKYVFSGTVRDTDGKMKLIRVMEAPSLFVLEQPL